MVVFSIKLNVKNFVVISGLRNKRHEIVFIIRMFAYSARKNRANGPDAYSTLKPDTSSDSPSVKSNGARLVSASVEMYHIIIRGQEGAANQIDFCVIISVVMEKFPTNIKVESKMIPRVTS